MFPTKALIAPFLFLALTGLTKSEPEDNPDAASPEEIASTDPAAFEDVTAEAKPAEPEVPKLIESGQVAVLKTGQLANFDKQPSKVQALLKEAMELTELGLDYQYASAKPSEGGMDCSGTIYYLLREVGVKDVPRQSDHIYRWAWKNGHFRAVNGNSRDTFEFAELKPGMLMFWINTYEVDRDPPVTHVMIYCGQDKETGKDVMTGASNGRSYNGKSRNGVSAFHFRHPSGGSGRFIGYAGIPGIHSQD